MNVISRRTLVEFWTKHPNSQGPLQAWYAEASVARWETPQEIVARYSTARAIGDGRIVFKIAGNTYRLIVFINYRTKVVLVRFVGTHAEYDKIDAETI